MEKGGTRAIYLLRFSIKQRTTLSSLSRKIQLSAMATSEISSVDDYCIDPTDNETDFSDSGNAGDWDGVELIINEDNLITNESRETTPSKVEKYRKECWQCNLCNTINNVRQCIKKYGSKCMACKTECYIASQRPTIMYSECHSNGKLFSLQMEQLWQCELCLMINDKSIPNCSECENPAPMTVTHNKINNFTEKERATHLIHGFVRQLEYYLGMVYIGHALLGVIQNFYFIDYLKEGWIIGTVKCMSITSASNLNVGDKLDFRNPFGRFEAAVVKKISPSDGECKRMFGLILASDATRSHARRRRVHWATRRCVHWCDYNMHRLRFAEVGAVSARPAHRLTNIRTGDLVDINPIYFEGAFKEHRGWKHGTVEQMHSESGQVLVMCEYKGKYVRYWTHLDNEDEISEYGSKTADKGKTLFDLLKDEMRKQEFSRRSIINKE